MPKVKNSNKNNTSESVKLLYEVLLEEYERLGILSKAEADAVRDKKNSKFENDDADKRRQEFGDFMLAELRHAVHVKVKQNKKTGKDKETPFAALCFSGGGIRSATFNLGVLQGLARHKLLEKFHYLSTVSGGGYIGSWLSAWIYRKRKEDESKFNKDGEFSTEYVKKVQNELALKRHAEGENTGQGTDEENHEVEPLEITHLRAYSNYMSPRPGLFTVDTWTLITVYIRNLLLNWTVFIPLIAAALLLPRVFYGIIARQSNSFLPPVGTYGGDALLVLGLGFLAGCAGVGCMIAMRPTLRTYFWSKQDREKDVKSAEPFVMSVCIFLVLFLAFGFTVFWAWYQKADFTDQFKVLPIYYFIISGVGLYFLGGIIALIFGVIRGLRKQRSGDANKKTFYPVSEFIAAVASGGIGGALLYVVINLFSLAGNLQNFQLLLACFGIPAFLVVFLLSATIFIGAASKITDDMDREWLSRFGAILLIVAVAWGVMSSVVIFGHFLLHNLSDWIKGSIVSVGGISGIITLVLGFSRKSEAKDETETKSKTSFLLWFAPQVAAPIFALFLMMLIAFGTYQLMYFMGKYISLLDMVLRADDLEKISIALPSFRISLIWLAISAAIGALMGYVININKFSLHATYRERLIRSYLGASRAEERLKTANSFTGLDDEDNVEMKELLQRPFHVVNMTLNLANSKNLRWQNRKAESFTATALHCGSSNMDDGVGSYRDSEIYGHNPQSGRSISLGTAAAISGAAASPNMGYYTSSKAVSFLMALFNVRLGWWLGNPGKTGEKTYKLPAPKWSPKVFFAEALGLTDDAHKYIYLSDGGHFDNLGLYEMVLRRVNLIVACDSGADFDFDFNDFGTAIHKIRVDMGIPIEFDSKNDAPMKGRNCVIGTIKYSEIDGKDAVDGTLIYIKPTLDGDESLDLVNYSRSNKDFPHESTADQMYSETQFESYRKLGSHMINSFCCEDKKNIPCTECYELSDLFANAEKYLERVNAAAKKEERKKKTEK